MCPKLAKSMFTNSTRTLRRKLPSFAQRSTIPPTHAHQQKGKQSRKVTLTRDSNLYSRYQPDNLGVIPSFLQSKYRNTGGPNTQKLHQ